MRTVFMLVSRLVAILLGVFLGLWLSRLIFGDGDSDQSEG